MNYYQIELFINAVIMQNSAVCNALYSDFMQKDYKYIFTTIDRRGTKNGEAPNELAAEATILLDKIVDDNNRGRRYHERSESDHQAKLFIDVFTCIGIHCAGHADHNPKETKSCSLTNKEILDIVDSVFEAESSLIGRDAGAGLLPHEYEEIRSHAIESARDDLIYMRKINGKVGSDVNSIPNNVKAVLLYRLYHKLYEYGESSSVDYIKCVVYDLYAKCSKELGVCIHPDTTLYSPICVGNKVIISRHTTIEQNCRISDGVVIYPFRVHPSKQYNIKIGEGSLLMKNVRLTGNFAIAPNSRVSSGAVICLTEKEVYNA